MRRFKVFNPLSLIVIVLLGLQLGYAQPFDLTGLWHDNTTSSNVTYRVRQIGNDVYWSVDGTNVGSYANVFFGEISGNILTGTWIDLPGSPGLGYGTLTLQIQSNDWFVKLENSPCCYGAQEWIREGSTGGVGGTGCSSSAYTLTASPSTARPGEAINVSFTFAGAGPNPKDWVALFEVGVSSYLGWFYAINENDCQATFYAPTTPGQYEFRYLLNDSYDQLATVTGLTVVSTAGDTKLWDWATRGVGEQRGQVGLRLSFICPANGSPGAVLGTDIYTDDSGICPAAVHAGVISLEQGGTVTIELLGAQQSYTGSTRNGITSVDFGPWPLAFRFVQ